MPLLHTAHLKVREDAVAPFEARLAHHAAITLERECGCLRFDFFQDRTDPTLFLLYEIYADEEALQVHRAAPHYLSFREDVQNWVVKRDWWFWQWPSESKSPQPFENL